jgi:ABC-type uncharacterized transport system fused permease/ATPase subunit
MTAGTSPDGVFRRETAVRLGRAVRNFVTSEVSGRAKLLGALLLGLLLGINALNVLNSYVSRFFMTAIERREWSAFVQMGILYVGVFAALTCVAVSYRFVEERLGLLWREWLTRRLVAVYLEGQTYYHVEAGGLDVERDWDALLSLEEQRLLSFARILLARPRFAVLSRLDKSLGSERFAQLVRDLLAREVGCIVVGEGGLAGEPFGAVIALAPDGSWTKTIPHGAREGGG